MGKMLKSKCALLLALLVCVCVSGAARAQNLASPGYRCTPAATAPASFSVLGNIGIWCPSTGPNANMLVERNADGSDSVIAGGVASVSNSNGTLTISPTTGAVVASLNLAHANTWSATQGFGTITFGGGSEAQSHAWSGIGSVVNAATPGVVPYVNSLGNLSQDAGSTGLTYDGVAHALTVFNITGGSNAGFAVQDMSITGQSFMPGLGGTAGQVKITGGAGSDGSGGGAGSPGIGGAVRVVGGPGGFTNGSGNFSDGGDLYLQGGAAVFSSPGAGLDGQVHISGRNSIISAQNVLSLSANAGSAVTNYVSITGPLVKTDTTTPFDLSTSSGYFYLPTGDTQFNGSSNTFSAAWLTLSFDGSSVGGTSSAGTGAIRYNNTTHVIEKSENGGGWTNINSGAGTVTSIATTGPISGGTITSTGTISCPTCINGSPSATGDLLYSTSGTQAVSRLADVAAGSYLRSGGTSAAPVWSTLTLPNAATTGDLLAATGSNAVGRIAAVAANSFLQSAGTSTLPAWVATPVFGAGLTASGATANDFSGGSGAFKTSTGASTFGGSSNTFTNAITVSPTTNQLALGAAAHLVTISSTAPAAAAQTLTIPDTGGADTFVFTALAQTLASKTLTAPVINGLTSSGSTAIDFSGNSGTFHPPTGAATFGGSANLFTAAVTIAGVLTENSGVILTQSGAPTLGMAAANTDTNSNRFLVYSGDGGASSTATGGTGGLLLLQAGAGGAGAAAHAAGIGGAVQVQGGDAGANGGGGGNNGGNVTINAGAGTGAGTNGTITIGSKAVSLTGLTTFSAGILASGSTAIDWSGNSGAYKTTTGAVTIGNGAVGITGLATFSAGILASGSTANDFSGGSGAFKVSTGASTFGGSSNTFTNAITISPTTNQLVLGAAAHLVTISSTAPSAAAQTLTIPDTGGADTFVFTTLAQTLASKTLTAPVINGATSSGSTAIDWSGNSGAYKTTTGAVTIGSGAISLTGSTTVTSGKFITTTSSATVPPASVYIAMSGSYTNSWVDNGAGAEVGGYYKDALGFVHLKGTVKNGTSASAGIFTLPTGYRPLNQINFMCTSAGVQVVMLVSSAGVISMFGGGSTTSATMDGITFYAEQ
jgi:hypothetical protein